MLDLLVRLMMPRLFSLLALFLISAQQAPPIAITFPRAGDVLRGQVTITGSTDAANFLSAQLDFAYASDSTDTWFAIQALSQPVLDSALAAWDTNSITDGDYILRLRVSLSDGTFQEVTVSIKIQNDVPFSTPTTPPTVTPETIFEAQIPTPFLLAASPTPTEVPRPTPTALPPNPASLTQNTILASLGRGALVILGLFLLAGLLVRLRSS